MKFECIRPCNIEEKMSEIWEILRPFCNAPGNFRGRVSACRGLLIFRSRKKFNRLRRGRSPRQHPLPLVLQRVELVVPPLRAQELLMVPLLHDPAMIHDHDHIRILNR